MMNHESGMIIAIICISVFSVTTAAAETNFIVSNGLVRQRLEPYISYCVDETKDLLIEDIVSGNSPPFVHPKKERLMLGYHKDTYWLKLKTENPSNRLIKWYLEYNYPPMDYITLYAPSENGYQAIETGDRFEFAHRPIHYRTFVFPLEEYPGTRTYYIRIQSSGAIVAYLTAWSPECFERKINIELMILGIYYGIMIALAFYNAFIYLSVRERAYLYLIFFIISYSMFTMAQNGIASWFIWQNAVWWTNRCNPFFVFLTLILSLLFTRTFLNTQYEAPKFDAVINMLAVISIVSLPLSLFAEYHYVTQFSAIISSCSSILMICTGIIRLKKGMRQAVFYLSSWASFLIGTVLYALMVYGFVPRYFIMEWGQQIGSSILALLLSLGIADKINTIRKERETALEALKESEEKYRILVENSHEGLILTINQKPVFANKMLIEKSGYTEQEFYSMNILDFFPPTSRGRDMIQKQYSRRGYGEDVPERYEAQVITKNGQIVDVLISWALIPIAGEIGTITIITDISELKKAEDALRKAHDNLEKRVEERTAELKNANSELQNARKAAEASAKSRSEFLANMSHEIRTPMNAIIGMCDLALMTDPSRKQREYLEIIRTSSRSLLRLINDILDFSKIEAGKLEFENVQFSPREVIEEVSDMFIEGISKKKLEFIVDISPEVPKKVIGDPLRLRQVLLNLTSNAFKFTSQGEICILCSIHREIDQKEPSTTCRLLFCVKDTGIGIDPQFHSRLFDAFTQADGSTTRKYGGTGLGLAICKRIIELMGGKIHMKSTLGVGTSFFFTACFQCAEPMESKKILMPDLKALNFLVVEDNCSALKVINQLIESFGCRTVSAASGEEALAIYEQSIIKDNPFDLILMDLSLPGMDGIETSEKIKANPKAKAPPIILNTTFSGEADIQRAEKAGIEGCLTKPIKPSILFNTIMEIFGYAPSVSHISKIGLTCPKEFMNMSVLLVEDHPVNRRVGTEILQSVGITVETAENGFKAVEAIKKKQQDYKRLYDVVLMDVQMPEMDGIESTRTIRSIGIDIPIIAMTAHAMTGDKERCIEAGMNDYVSKPIDRKQLFAALRKVSGQKDSGQLSVVSGQKDSGQLSVVSVQKESGQLSVVSVQKDSGQLSVVSDQKPTELASYTSSNSLTTDHLFTDHCSLTTDHLFTDHCSLTTDQHFFDIESGVERIGGSWETFLDILKDFCSVQNGFADNFKELIKKGDFKTARLNAHALKGAAGNLSANDLEKAAKNLEDACISENMELTINRLLSVEESIARVIVLYENLEKKNRLANTSPVSPAIVRDSERGFGDSIPPELLRKFEESLKGLDPVESKHYLNEIKSYIELDSDEEKIWMELEQQINKYDFDEAIKNLRLIDLRFKIAIVNRKL